MLGKGVLNQTDPSYDQNVSAIFPQEEEKRFL